MTDQPIKIIDFFSGNVFPDVAQLRDEEGIQILIRKFSEGGGPDARLETDIPLLRRAGDILGGYHWCDPTQGWLYQAGCFLKEIDRWRPNFLMYDIEQGWPWKNASQLDYSTALPPAQILDNAEKVVTYVQKNSGLPYLLYTSADFVFQCCKGLGQWIGEQPAMIASYPDYTFMWPAGQKARRPYHVSDFDRFNPRAKTISEYVQRMPEDWFVDPPGATNVKVRQITSRVLFKNGNPYDLSRWEGTEEELRKFLNLPDPVDLMKPAETFADLGRGALPPTSYIGAYMRSGGK